MPASDISMAHYRVRPGLDEEFLALLERRLGHSVDVALPPHRSLAPHLDLVLGERGGRLVEHQDAGVERERLDDLHPLPLAENRNDYVFDNEVLAQAIAIVLVTPINFVGNVEGDDIYKGDVDVVVCDGFVGNVALKASEGVAAMLTTTMREEFSRNPLTKMAALIAMPVLRAFREDGVTTTTGSITVFNGLARLEGVKQPANQWEHVMARRHWSVPRSMFVLLSAALALAAAPVSGLAQQTGPGPDRFVGTGSGTLRAGADAPHLAEHSGERIVPGVAHLICDHVGDRVDQGEVGERLGEVADLLAGEGDLLGVEAEVVGVREHLLEGHPCLVDQPGPRQGVDVGEAAQGERALGATETVFTERPGHAAELAHILVTTIARRRHHAHDEVGEVERRDVQRRHKRVRQGVAPDHAPSLRNPGHEARPLRTAAGDPHMAGLSLPMLRERLPKVDLTLTTNGSQLERYAADTGGEPSAGLAPAFVDAIKHIILPAVALGTIPLAIIES